jgi:uncharacterized protein YndB with AHSA1/START domain
MENKIKASATIEIEADSSKVWLVLTTPSLVKQFMLGMQPTSDWKEGSELRWQGRHEEKPDDNARGKIVTMEAGSRLAYTFYYPGYGYPDKDEYYNLVSFVLLSLESNTLVTVEQGDFSVFKEGEEFAKHSSQFWEMALQKLKELAEQA